MHCIILQRYTVGVEGEDDVTALTVHPLPVLDLPVPTALTEEVTTMEEATTTIIPNNNVISKMPKRNSIHTITVFIPTNSKGFANVQCATYNQ